MDKKVPPFQSYSSRQSPSPRTPGKSLYVVLFILLVIVIGVGAAQFLSARSKELADATPSPIEFIEPTDEPIPTQEPVTEEDKETSPTPSQEKESDTTDSATGLDRADYSIEVLNGSGIGGKAGDAADVLKELGYTISNTDNADSFDYEETEISVSSKNKKLLDLLKKDLSDDYTIGSTSTTYTGDSDAQVIVGKE